VAVVAWPAESPVEGGYSTVEDVVGRGLLTTVGRNEPLTAAKLAAPESGAGLPALVTAGMRALSVRVNDVIGVAGFVVTGTRVDVIVIIRAEQDTVSRTVVSNVQVLAAGTNIDRDAARSGQAQQASVVTLLVAPEDGEKIALAQSQGQIMLALRNPLDVAPVETRGVRTSGLLGAPNPEPQRRVVQGRARMVSTPPPPPPAPYTVETIRGALRTQEVVQ
jgi:pilus assembly protein CpaB